MPFDCSVSNGHIYRVSVQGKIDGSHDVVNAYQIMLNTGGPVDAAVFRSDLKSFFTDLYDLVAAICSVVTIWEGFEASHLNGNCSTGVVPFDSSIAGAVSGDAGPPGAAMLMSFRTGVQRVILRKYFGSLGVTAFDAEGNLDAATKAAGNAARTFILSPQTYNGHEYQIGYNSPKAGQWVTPIGAVTSDIIAYQRRRRPGTGS